jgi:hypothetical protein
MRGPRHVLRVTAAWLATVLVVLTPARVLAEDAPQPRAGAAHKAAYLRHIAELTTWPDASFGAHDAPIVIGVLGKDTSGVVALLERRIRGKGLSAQKRRLELRQLSVPATPGDLEGCHLLFVPSARGADWEGLRSLLAGRSVVTVSDIQGFSLADGMIEFVFDTAESRVSLHIDLATVEKAGLKLSSKLLGLKHGVKIVRSPGEGEA